MASSPKIRRQAAHLASTQARDGPQRLPVGPSDTWGPVPAPRAPGALSPTDGTHTRWCEFLATGGLCAPQQVVRASVLPYVKWGQRWDLPYVAVLESHGTWPWEVLSQGLLVLWYTVAEGIGRFWNTNRRE